jgi:hypothetical protein
MQVPVVIAPKVEQDPLRVPALNLDVSPANFGAAVAHGMGQLGDVFSEEAVRQKRDAVEADVSKNLSAAQDLSNQAVTKARTVVGPDATLPGFVDQYDKEISKAWEDAAKASASPQSRSIIEAKGAQDRMMSLDAIRNHQADQIKAHRKVSNELVVQKETQAARLAPEDDNRQKTSAQNIAAMVRSNLIGSNPNPSEEDKSNADAAVKDAVSAMYLEVAKSIGDKDPNAATNYFKKHEADIVPSDDKKAFENALATKTKDFNGEMLARASVADPKSKTFDDVTAYLQEKTKGDGDTVRYDEALSRAKGYWNTRQVEERNRLEAIKNTAFMRLYRSGYNIDTFNAGDIAEMGADNYAWMRSQSEAYKHQKEADAVAKGEMTPARAAHIENYANFLKLAKENPRYLVEGKSYTQDWAAKLGPEYADKGMARWQEIEADLTNPGSRTVTSTHSEYVIQDTLRTRMPSMFPAEDSPTKWSAKAAKFYLEVENGVNDRMAVEQKNKPGYEPTPSDIRAWTIDEIKDYKLRENGKTVKGTTLGAEQQVDPKVVMPEDEQAFRAFYVPYHKAKSASHSTPSDDEVYQKYVQWISDGRPALPSADSVPDATSEPTGNPKKYR